MSHLDIILSDTELSNNEKEQAMRSRAKELLEEIVEKTDALYTARAEYEHFVQELKRMEEISPAVYFLFAQTAARQQQKSKYVF